jgi:hypothetical protein
MRLLPVLFLLVGCGQDPVLKGQVVDIWGQPVSGATVMIVGQANARIQTDNSGLYAMTRLPGSHEFKVGREGYIQQHAQFSVDPSNEQAGPTFQLYKKPAEVGFYIVGAADYDRLEAQTVHSVGNELKSFHGLKSAGDAGTEGTTIRVIYHNDLKMDELMRLGLELHKLNHVSETTFPGPLGSEMSADVNLWVSEGEVAVNIEPTASKTDYLITSKEPLKAGTYAFHTQDLLTPKDLEAFAQLPDALRVAFPFTVRQ